MDRQKRRERPAGRRSREEARTEILDTAEGFLRQRPFQELKVGELMQGTSIGRSAFYVYFQDRYQLIAALLERLEAQLVEAAEPWLGEVHLDPLADVRSSIERTVAVWVAHGPVLRAIADAAPQDELVQAAYRWGLLERFIVAVAERIEEGQKLGRVQPLNPPETAAALILMNERYLADRLGTVPQSDPEEVVETLYGIWTAVLYGPPRRVAQASPHRGGR